MLGEGEVEWQNHVSSLMTSENMCSITSGDQRRPTSDRPASLCGLVSKEDLPLTSQCLSDQRRPTSDQSLDGTVIREDPLLASRRLSVVW